MSFEQPELLWLAAALPAAVALGLWLWVRRRRRAARVLGGSELLRRLGAGDLESFPARRVPLLVLAAAALGVAAAGPQWGLESVEEQTSSADLVLALDVSKSMLAQDIAPNRLERERVLARRVLRERPVLDSAGLAISGHDLRELGLTPGPRFGEILDGLLERVLEEPSLNRRDALLRLVREEWLDE